MKGPGTYRIVVQGEIPVRWEDKLQGMTIEPLTRDDNEVVTSLFGSLSDQSALSAVLNTIHDLHRTVLSVERL